MLVINKVIDLAKRQKEECMLFKVNFEKAYDSVSWGYLEYTMGKMRFGEKWLCWIRFCLYSSTMSMLVNRSPTWNFMMHEGL